METELNFFVAPLTQAGERRCHQSYNAFIATAKMCQVEATLYTHALFRIKLYPVLNYYEKPFARTNVNDSPCPPRRAKSIFSSTSDGFSFVAGELPGSKPGGPEFMELD